MAALYQYCTQGAILKVDAKMLEEHNKREISRHDCPNNKNAVIFEEPFAAIKLLPLYVRLKRHFEFALGDISAKLLLPRRREQGRSALIPFGF